MLLWQHQKQKICPQADATVGLYSRLIQMGHDQFSSSSIGAVTISATVPWFRAYERVSDYKGHLWVITQAARARCARVMSTLQRRPEAGQRSFILHPAIVLSQPVLPVLCQRGAHVPRGTPRSMLARNSGRVQGSFHERQTVRLYSH